MKIGKNILLLVLVWLILSIIFTPIFGKIYQFFVPQYSSLFIVSQEFVDIITGIGLAYTFFLTLIFTAFGDKSKYWWIAILLIPVAVFEIYFDLAHLYFPIALGLAGWLLGLGILKVQRMSSRTWCGIHNQIDGRILCLYFG